MTFSDKETADINAAAHKMAKRLGATFTPNDAALPVEVEPVAWVSDEILAAMKRGERAVPGWKHSEHFHIALYPASAIEKLQADLATAIEANKTLMAERDAYAQSVKDLGGIVRHNIARAETAEALASSETERADRAWNDAIEAATQSVTNEQLDGESDDEGDRAYMRGVNDALSAIRKLRKEPT